MQRRLQHLIALGIALASMPIEPAGAADWVRVARTGELVPALDDSPPWMEGSIFLAFDLARRVAGDGTIAFVAQLEKDGAPLPDILYRHRSDGSELLAGGSLGSVQVVDVNDRGDVLLESRKGFYPTACGNARQRSLTVYLAEGGERTIGGGFDTCLDSQCLSFWNPRPLSILDWQGGVAFFAELPAQPCPVGRSRAAFGPDGSGAERLVALAGDPAPEIPGVTLGNFVWGDRAINESGQFAFWARLSDGGHALYRADPESGLELLARTGAPSPLAGGAVFTRLQTPALDASGVPAFFASEEPIDPDEAVIPPHALWGSDGSGGVRRLAAGGELVPGGPTGAVFPPLLVPGTPTPFLSTWSPPVNSLGEVAATLPIELAGGQIVSGLLGPTASAAFTLRVLVNDPAPGVAGATISAIVARGVDDDREVFFEAMLEGAGIDESNDRAWYLQSPGHAARLLLREGDLFDFGAGDPRVLRDYAKVVADADFEHFAIQLDGEEGESAVFVTTVPEPSTSPASAWALVALGLLASRRCTPVARTR